MNSSKFIIKTYLKNLKLNKLSKNQLKKLKNVKTFQSIHEIIGNDEYCSNRIDDAPLKSISSRINGIWSNLLNNIQFEKDSLNRTILKATPKLNRSILISENWITNPFKNIWKSFYKKKIQKNQKKDIKKLKKKKYYKISIRRFILLIVTLLQTIIATCYMKNILPYQKISFINNTENFNQNWKEHILLNIPYTLEICILFLFSILFCWLSASFWTALMGFVQLIGNNKNNISYSLKKKITINPKHYTAIIMPICNEDVDLAFAGLKATWKSLTKTGNNKYFDIYILSDSYNADTIISEQKSWMDLVYDLNAYGKIFYRRRKRCVKRKSGNIDDFCRRWGNNYQYMIILDADSVMSGECLTNLVNMMEINPKAGIIQSYPKAYGMNTFYARCQQFSMRIYGPIFTAGLHFWQLGESHYWGHNAIIRLQPFIKHCSLAPLPGKGVFSGSILSHDFVEAALMRRAGWNVWIAYDLPGSYEELPPNLLDELKRDRRWCYGNLMNFRLFLVKGVHPVHRTVFLTGVMSYISAPLWFIFLILSTLLQLSQKFIETSYTLKSNQVLLKLTEWKPELTLILFSTTLFLLFLPKLLSIILICFKDVKSYGGIKKFFISIILEMIFSILLAPIRMLFHTIFILKAFIGCKILWHSPQRDDKSTHWSYAFKKHSSQVILGLIWLILIIFLDIKFLFYLSPIIFSWILSPFISVLSSRTAIGLKSKKLKLFMTPEEYNPPNELVDAKHYLKINRKTSLKNGFMHALFNPTINALATGLATSRHKNNKLIEFERDRKINELLNNSPQLIKYKQKLEIINDPVILARIHSNLWSNLNKYNKWISLYKKIILNSKIFLKRTKF